MIGCRSQPHFPLSLILSCLTLLGCGTRGPGVEVDRQPGSSGMLPVTWSPALGLKSLGDIDRRLTEPWDVSFELRIGNTGATVQSCAESLAFRGQRVGVEPESDGPSLMRISED